MSLINQLRRLYWWLLGRLPMVGNRGNLLMEYLGRSGCTVFCGPNGSGKSLLAVEALLPTLDGVAWECNDLDHMHNIPVRRHTQECGVCVTRVGEETFCPAALALLEEHGRGERLAYSTLVLLDDTTGREHHRYRALTSLRQLPHIEHADVLFDEVSGVSDADSSANMSGALKRWIQQLRKRDVFLYVTSPAYDRCSLPIRQIATAVVDARSFYPMPSTTSRRWRPRLAMIFKAYDGFDFRSFDKNSAKTQQAEATLYYWRSSHRAMNCYKTTAQTHALADVEESGLCIVCNGGRTRPSCACSPDVYEMNPDELVIVETTGPRGGRARKAVPVWEAEGCPSAPAPGAHAARYHDTPTAVLAAVDAN